MYTAEELIAIRFIIERKIRIYTEVIEVWKGNIEGAKVKPVVGYNVDVEEEYLHDAEVVVSGLTKLLASLPEEVIEDGGE